MKTYFDTSAIAKRYVLESGTEQVNEILSKTAELALSALALPELISALSRLKRENKLNASSYKTIKDNIYKDLADIILHPISPSVINLTVDIIEKNKIKTLDAIHLATACEWGCDYFVSADKMQITAAQNIGLEIIHLC